MPNLVTCPSCGHQFSPDEVLTHELEEQIRAKLGKEIAATLKKETEKDLLAKEEELKALKKLVEQANEQELKLLREKREIEDKGKRLELEIERKMNEEREKVRLEAEKTFAEKNRYKLDEYEKKLRDMGKALEEAQRKGSQGSQQAQGEVMELDVEAVLRAEFPTDSVSEVKKGVRGADVLQTIIDKRGKDCGTILWESKNATWSQGWIAKLKEDGRASHAHLYALVTMHAPDEIKSFSYLDGVWVVRREHLVALATALRYNLISLSFEQSKNEGRREKSEVLYQYVTSHEFRGRIEAIVEAFSSMQEELEREKRWFNSKWSRQEKQIRAVIDNTGGMYADMQGYVGKALPTLSHLELPE